MLNALLEPMRVKRYFDWIGQAKLLGEDLLQDLSFLRTVGRFVRGRDLPPAKSDPPFPPRRAFEVPALAGKKVGIVATGGGGAMVSAIGVMRACEEAGLQIAAISACSGSALFLAPIAAGMSAEQTARFVLSWRTEDYLDPDWSELLKLPLSLGRGFAGVIRGDAVQRLIEQRVSALPVGQLPIPYYANVWDMDHNRVLYWGTRTTPRMLLPQVVRVAMTLPLYVCPVEIDGVQYGDGGVVNIFPVDPLVDHHPELDYFIGINGFHPAFFAGEDLTGWNQQTFSLVRFSTQTIQCQHLEVARQQLRRIADRCTMCHPVPYHSIRGFKFYEQFIDRRDWPQTIARGRDEARAQLARLGQEV